jgi:hypothetical protein
MTETLSTGKSFGDKILFLIKNFLLWNLVIYLRFVRDWYSWDEILYVLGDKNIFNSNLVENLFNK